MNTSSRKYYIEKLKTSGNKITKPRMLVLAFLASSKKPVSAQKIVHTLKGKIDQVTVYRILEMFKKSNLVNQIDFQDGNAYFELKDIKHDHHHIICTNCKKVKDFKGPAHQKLITKVLQNTPEFSEITSHSFELFGLCRSCSHHE